MPPTIAKVFNALNGHELKTTILRELDQVLSNSDDFRQNRTYREFSYEFRLSIVAKPREPNPAFEVTTERHLQEYDRKTGEPVPPGENEQPIILDLRSSRAHDARTEPPDLIRKEVGLPIPQAREIAGQTVELSSEDVELSKYATSVADIARDVTETRSVEVRRDLNAPPRVSGEDTGA